jgi:signal transduction histidine kinase
MTFAVHSRKARSAVGKHRYMSDSDKVEALVQLAGSVAHELNNIFTAVHGNLSLLEAHLDEKSDQAKVVGDVMRTTKRGIELSEKLQAFAGRQPLRRSEFDLNRVAANIFGVLARGILRNVAIEFSLERESCMVCADEDKLSYVIEELACNAGRAMNHVGSIQVSTARVFLKDREMGRLPGGSYVKFSLRDSGRGMKPEIARRAFDPVFSTEPGSNGWGLAKCAGFIRQSGGDILLSTAPSQGTTMTFYLPLSGKPAASPRRV